MNAYEIAQQMSEGLPTRETEWGPGGPHLMMRDGVIKLTKSKESQVYWKYYDFTIACPYLAHMDFQMRMQEAHQRGKIAVAYLECRCQECRFVPRDYCPESWDTVLAAFETHYPQKALDRYGYVVEEGDTERDYADEQRFYEESQCLVVQAIRERNKAIDRLRGQVVPNL